MRGEHQKALWFVVPTPPVQASTVATTMAVTSEPAPFSTFTSPAPSAPTSVIEDTLPFVAEEEDTIVSEQPESSEE